MDYQLINDIRENIYQLTDVTSGLPASGYLLKVLPDFNERNLDCGFAIEMFFVGAYFTCVDNNRRISVNEVELMKQIFRDFIPENSAMMDPTYLSMPAATYKTTDLLTAPYSLETCVLADNQQRLRVSNFIFEDSLSFHVYQTYDVFLDLLINADGVRKFKEEYAYGAFISGMQRRIRSNAAFKVEF